MLGWRELGCLVDLRVRGGSCRSAPQRRANNNTNSQFQFNKEEEREWNENNAALALPQWIDLWKKSMSEGKRAASCLNGMGLQAAKSCAASPSTHSSFVGPLRAIKKMSWVEWRGYGPCGQHTKQFNSAAPSNKNKIILFFFVGLLNCCLAFLPAIKTFLNCGKRTLRGKRRNEI